MSLAQRLNELASANSKGLLDDDDYRLLRQDVFERYSRDTPDSPAASRGRCLRYSIFSTVWSVFVFVGQKASQLSWSLTRSKASVSFGVTSLFRRATSRKPAKDDAPAASSTNSTNSLKRAFIPRMLSRKQSVDMMSIRTTSSGIHNDAFSMSLYKTSLVPGTFSPPRTRSTYSKRVITPLSHPKIDPSISDDIFEDGGLTTTKGLRQFINELETERQRVLKAFDDLENSAVERQRHAMAIAPLASTEWRSPNKVASSSMLEGHIPIQASNDALSVWSNVSVTRSKSSSQKPPGPSSIRRKGSVSSVSSQGTSLLSVNRPTISSHTSLSRSSGHLPLGVHSMRSSETVGLEDDMTDLQRRRLEVTRRYEARLEYLRARLKGAELHEKLLKK
ncbi:uncharacterized protein BT62DRAFT_990872 [Guyanagaster necrorhizus]|uniref:Uncharacterized protein n=1 Tax=Guyanagaster necrorhizus TaxID=856835 RepID=A0A9P7W3F4_9AGAR|nr:uncharacterized protein BT62DRAFT_990872 [Guyanagaster necrorhizus MCA 3950]KAG7451260.1 hypothetical protein BT62DRAFT_990872 [Guyanagaster necrorhizus MCA 3950]